MTAPVRFPLYAAPCDHGRTPRVLLALDERSRWLREAADRFFPGASHDEQARRLYRAINDYAASPWLRECGLLHCPKRHKGRVQEFCWMILKARDAVPARRTIRGILDGRATRGQKVET
jgi:hypothetical protein